MHRIGTQFLELGKNQLSNIIPKYRNLRILAGKIRNNNSADIIPSITNDNAELVQAGKIGFHKIVIVEHCTDKQCHNKSCNTIHEKACSLKSNTSTSVTELAGGLTHKVPQDKIGITFILLHLCLVLYAIYLITKTDKIF
jgi:hypothetical protein